jgi:hypothetical protein
MQEGMKGISESSVPAFLLSLFWVRSCRQSGTFLFGAGRPGSLLLKLEKNARYYELQISPVAGASLTVAESSVIITTQARCDLPPMTPGSQVQMCVRAVGVKGPSPFCNALTVRVN